MSKKLSLKDIILIALLTAVYMILYFIAMGIISVLGPFGHAISPGIAGILSGAVLYFMNRKIGKMWEYSLFTLIVMAIFALMGGAYLPWLITSMITAMIADFISSKSNDTPVWKLAVSSGLMHMGQAWGAIIPSLFFVESYRNHWIARGQSPADMDANIYYTGGMFGILASVLTFALSFIGMYIGYLLLRKHFKEK